VNKIAILRNLKSVLQTERAKRVNLPNTLLQSTNRKTLRAGIVDQKGRRGARPLCLKRILHFSMDKIR